MKTLFFIFIFILLSSFLHATIINVPGHYTTIQAGINAATNSDTVLVQPGTYFENINYNGKLITVGSLFLTTRDTTYISSTIIDGNSSGRVVTFSNDENSSAVLCGFTITNGLASGGYPASRGGGIYCDSSSPSLQNVTITGNSAILGGGICCFTNSSPSLDNVTISDNTASDDGGGIYCENNSNPSLDNVTISNNSTGYYGGGILCYNFSSPSLQNVTITGNSAGSYGGGISCFTNSSPSLDNVTISDNTTSDDGGGIYCYDSSPVLINSILWNDSPQEIYIESGSVIATYSDIQGGWTGTDNIDNNPLFVDPGNENYNLQSTSPCIDAGDPVSPLDPDGTIADMGAYYFHQHFGPVWHVSTTGSDVWGNGSTQNPFATIQLGINFSSNSDTVLVQPGTYMENINYNGKLITVGSLLLTTQDTTYISATIIDGNSSGSVVTFNNGEDSTTILCGFTITNGSNDLGGGICCLGSSPGLQNITMSGNSAASSGGGLYCSFSSPSLQNVTISDNSAANYGGGIFFYGFSDSNLNNVTISGNSADYGGGITCWYYSDPSFYNVTISGNTANFSGGGIHCFEYSNPVFLNAIMWNDSPQEIYIETGSVTATYSDIEGGWAGTGNIDIDPLFVAPGSGDYHLQATSPCIDAGDPASPLDPDGTTADMGAYYFHQHFGPVWHISTTGSDVWGNGSTQNPFATIQHGINVSSNTDTVLVQPGTYVENIDYNGKLITVGSLFLTNQDTTYISSTIIDGNSNGRVVTFTNDENSSAIICGFTITNGLASGSYPDNYGGGIYCYSSSPILQNVTISGNAAEYGGGIYCYSSSLSLVNVTISGNSGASSGGGILCDWYSSPILQNVIITGNSAGQGGGIFCYYHSSPSLNSVTISGNSATSNGGGIYFYSSSPSLENVTISGNSATSNGGGIYCSGSSSSPVLINSILWNDSPEEIYIISGSVTATYSDIEGGWAGTGNIDIDPLFVDAGNGDYHLQSTSLCIDAGDPVSPLDPDGTTADMGAYYFHQTIAPDPPQNVTIEIIGTDVHLSWDAVTGANSYKVYSSNDPYTGFVEDTSGSFAGESWSAPIGDVKKFYHLIASTETIRSKNSHLQDAYHPDRKSQCRNR